MSKLSVETEYDKAVEAVATSIIDCENRKTWHICDERDCVSCEIKRYQDNCMNNFADVDKLRVYNHVQALIDSQPVPIDPNKYAKGSDAFKIKAKFFIKELCSVIGTAAAIILIPLCIICIPGSCVAKASAQSLKDYSYWALPGESEYVGKYRKQILDTLNRTKQYVTDVNKDGEINCIDYSCTFKILWDKMYKSSDCEIVRNKSTTMNHLFIRTRQYAGRSWECIEPQAATRDITKYFMEDFWSPDIYNPMYNIYDETDVWLKEVKQ